MIFFTDENIPIKAAQMLGIFEEKHQIRACQDWFERGTPDTDWMAEVSSWDESETTVVVGGDSRILKNEVEKQVLKDSKLTFVLLAQRWLHLEWPVYAWKIIKVWPNIVQTVEQVRYPMVFKVAVGGLKIQTIGRISNL